jgi:hypothetical protein
MAYNKRKTAGRKERIAALSRVFPGLNTILNDGKLRGLPIEDMLDATVACGRPRAWLGGRAGVFRLLSHPMSPDCRWRSGSDVELNRVKGWDPLQLGGDRINKSVAHFRQCDTKKVLVTTCAV